MTALCTIHRLVEEFKAHDLVRIGELLAPGAQIHDPFFPEPLEGDAILQDYADLFFAFPDVEYRLETVLAAGGVVAGEALLVAGEEKAAACHGDEPGASMSRGLRLPFSFFTRVDAGGRIVEEHRYYDVGCLVEQLSRPRPAGVAGQRVAIAAVR